MHVKPARNGLCGGQVLASLQMETLTPGQTSQNVTWRLFHQKPSNMEGDHHLFQENFSCQVYAIHFHPSQ